MSTKDRKQIRTWYWAGALMIFLILVIGGITRLTQSGLSMVEWKPIMGVIPPLTDAQWINTFEQYKEFPEYRQRNAGMSLSDFKFIYFWEYLHRMFGRLIGLVFAIPFAYFLVKKKFSSRQLRRAVLLLVLGLGQGFLGWYMVQSGLNDVPYVSPYRLAAHLLLAFAIFGCCVWFALDLYRKRRIENNRTHSVLQKWIWIFFVILILQVTWGAFVAGLNAGHVYNTFPMMNQYWMPPEAWLLEPFVRNFFENSAAVQWIHRLLGVLLVLLSIGVWARATFSKADISIKKWGLLLLGLVLTQFLIGVLTLVYHVPISLGVIHQAVALILFGVTIGFLNRLSQRQVGPASV